MAQVPELERLGVRIEYVPREEIGPACGHLVDLVTNRKFVHIGQPVLEVAVAEAVRRSVGDVWVWDRRGRRDVSPLVAVTVGAWWASKPKAPERQWFLY
jgi:hypothetical protein